MSPDLVELLIDQFPNLFVSLVTLYLLWTKLNEIDVYLRSILDKLLDRMLDEQEAKSSPED